jgi:hypothetical protein
LGGGGAAIPQTSFSKTFYTKKIFELKIYYQNSKQADYKVTGIYIRFKECEKEKAKEI